jgi:hypothetical protein
MPSLLDEEWREAREKSLDEIIIIILLLLL